MDSYVFELSDVSIDNGSDTLTINNVDSVFGAIPGSMLWIDNYRPRFVASVDNTARTVTLTKNWNGDDVISQSATIAPFPGFADHQKAVDGINSAKTSVDALIERHEAVIDATENLDQFTFAYDVETAAELAASEPQLAGIRARCRARGDANYIAEPAGYVAKVGDIPAANGYTWRVFINDRRNVNLRQFGVIPGDRESGVECIRAAVDLLTPLGSGQIVIPDFGDDLTTPPNTVIINAMITMPTFITFTGETMRARVWVDYNDENADFPLIPFRGIYYTQNVRVAVLHGMIWDEVEQDLKPHPAQDGEIQTRKRIYKPQFNDFEIRTWGASELDTIGFLTGVGLRSQSTRTADFIRCSIRGFACKIAHTEVFSDVAVVRNCVLNVYHVDLVNLATIMFGYGVENSFGDVLASNGDGCLVETCQFGASDGAPIPHIAAVSRTNLRVIGNVNPSVHAYRCSMVEIASNKMETGWFRLDCPNSIISHNEIGAYVHYDPSSTPAPPIVLMDSSDKTLNTETTQPLHILEHNAFQRRNTDFRDGTALGPDVLIDYGVRVEIDNCYQSVGMRIGTQKLGIKIARLDGVTPIGDWDALSHLYSRSSTILANQGIRSNASIDVTQNDLDVFKHKFPGFGPKDDTRSGARIWDAPAGTYHYKFQILLDANVGIGVTLETTLSVDKPEGATATVLEYRETPDDRNHAFEDVLLRIYRGNADGVYDAVVNLNCIAIKNIWDFGNTIATSAWESRTPGPVDDIIEFEGPTTSKFFGYRLNGDGTKTLTGGLSAKKLNGPVVYTLKEERQFAIGFPEFLQIITHDVSDKTRSGREFRMLRSGDFIAPPWEPDDQLVADSIRVTSDGRVWHYIDQGKTGTDEPTAIGADGTATIDALVSTNGIYYRSSK